ncbi:hypothetical protein GCM10020218_061650 [Dactylosporangium vinaceum]
MLADRRVRVAPLLLASLGVLPGLLLNWLEREEIQAALQQDEQYTTAALESAFASGWQIELADGQTPVGEYLEHAVRLLFFARARSRSVEREFASFPPEEEYLRNVKQAARSRMRFVGKGKNLRAAGLEERSYWTLAEAVQEVNMRIFNPRLADGVVVQLADDRISETVIPTALVDKLTVVLKNQPFLGAVKLSVSLGRGAYLKLTDGRFSCSLELERGVEILPSWTFDARFIGLIAAAILNFVPLNRSASVLLAKTAGSLGLLGLSAAIWYRGHSLHPLRHRSVLPLALAMAAAGSIAEAQSAHRSSLRSTPGRFGTFAMAHVLGAYWSDLSRSAKFVGAASTLGILALCASKAGNLRTLVSDAIWIAAPAVSASAAHAVANGIAEQYTARRRALLRQRASIQAEEGRAQARAWLRHQTHAIRTRLHGEEGRLLTVTEFKLVQAELDRAEAILNDRESHAA